jgi:hypothetical protein
MEESRDEYYRWKDVSAGTKSFISYAVGKWIILLVFLIVTVGLGLAYYFNQKPKYEAVCTFILEEKQGLGGVGSLASQFGIDLGGMGSSSLFAGDNILDILKSNTITKKSLLSRIDSSKPGSGPTLADLYMEFSGLKEKKKLKDISFTSYRDESASLLQDSVLHLIQERLVKNDIQIERISRKGTIISVSVSSPNQYFSKSMAERMVDEARNLYINIKSGNAQANVRRLEFKADSILRQLNSKTYQAATLTQIDANPALRSLSVPSEISSRDKSVLGAVYLEVVKNLEMSKTLLNQQTPVIQLLDVPQLPIKDKKKSLFFILFVSVCFGGFLFTIYAWLKFSNRQSTTKIIRREQE